MISDHLYSDKQMQKTHMALRRSIAAIAAMLILAVVTCDFTFAYAQDCEPLKPEQPINSEISNQIKANANVLFRQLGSGEFENSSKKTQEDLQSKYPNADRVEIWRSLIYFECTLLKSSHLSDQDKQTNLQL
jgi:hypothetical protein